MNRNRDALSFLPRSVIRLFAEGGSPYSVEEGSALFADVAGFTPLTEALLILGKEGSEELTRILNHHFSSMIEITERYGGDVLRFAGDAMTVFFPGDDGREAVSCGLSMLEKMKEYSRVESRAGAFELAMKIGCARGAVQVGLLGQKGETDYYAFGEPLDASADAEHHASKGDLVASGTVKVPDVFLKTDRGEGFSLITGAPREPSVDAVETTTGIIPDPASILPSYIIEQSHPGVSGEHRGTAVIFLSFAPPKGSGKEAHDELWSQYEKMLTVVKKYGGIFNKVDFGDKGAKAVILFGAPVACENKEEMAVRTGMEIMRDIGKDGAVRMGITSSHLFSGPLGSSRRREFTVMGDGINLSARLMGYSKPGEIITDENTYDKSRDCISFNDRGEISVKGKSGLIRIFEPVSLMEENRAENLKKLYGREHIQQEIKEWLLSGDREPIVLLGDIGSGKTALAEWLYREAVIREFKVQMVDLQLFSREVFFSLFSRLLKKVFGINSRSDIPGLAGLIPPVSREFYPLLYPYFGYDEEKCKILDKLGPKDRRDISFSMLLSLFENIEDTVFIIDNLSFADEASLDFLSFALDNSERKLLDVIAFSRKEVTEKKIFGVFKKSFELPPLEKSHMTEFITDEFNLKGISDSFAGFLLDKSKGNPRLVIALMNSIKNENLLFEKDGSYFVDEDRLFKTQFPDSLEAVYLKEFDKLPSKEKQLMFEASVLGTNVSMNLLGKLSSFPDNEIKTSVDNLAKKGFVHLDSSGKRPYFSFSDTLLYEAVYSLAPFSLKRDLHREVFRALLEMEGDRKPQIFPYLAYHAQKADDKENSVKFHRLAGKDFLQKFDNLGALKHIDYAVQNVKFDDQYFEDAFSLFDLYLSLGKFNEAKELLDRLWKMEGMAHPKDLANLYNMESEKNIREGDTNKAEENLLNSLKIAERSKNLYGTAKALCNLVGRVFGPTGKYAEGKQALQRILSLQKFDGDSVIKIVALMNLGSIVRHETDYASAKQFYGNALKLAKSAKILPRQTAIISNLITLYYETSSFDKAIASAKKGMELASAFSQRELLLDISNHYSLSLWACGKTDRAIGIAFENMERAKLFGMPYAQAFSSVVLGVSQFEGLRFRDSLNNLEESIRVFESISCSYEAYSSKFEYLRLLKFMGDEESFDRLAGAWGGSASIIADATRLSLPQSLISILKDEHPVASDADDPDTSFNYWLKDKTKESLKLWLPDIRKKGAVLRHDLKFKWTWACMQAGLEPPFNPLRLLAISPGGIFGLRILAILFRQNLENGQRNNAVKIRKRLLDNLYFAKVHSDDQIWECVIRDGDIARAILGR